MLQHSSVMTISFCFQIKGDKGVCFTAWPKAPGYVAELPAPSNIPLCMCIPYTLAQGHGTDPQSFGKGKPPSNQSQLWPSRGWRQILWKHWLLSIPSGLGGAEVRKSNQEKEQRKYQEKKGEGDRVNVADITQLRRGSCTWKMENTSSVLLVVTEETDTSSCPPFLLENSSSYVYF